MASIDGFAVLDYQDQNLNPVVKNFVQDPKGGNALRSTGFC